VENRGCFVKVENGGFFVKSGPFLDAGCILYSISIFLILHFTYLGGVRTHPKHPLPTGLRRQVGDVKNVLKTSLTFLKKLNVFYYKKYILCFSL